MGGAGIASILVYLAEQFLKSHLVIGDDWCSLDESKEEVVSESATLDWKSFCNSTLPVKETALRSQVSQRLEEEQLFLRVTVSALFSSL